MLPSIPGQTNYPWNAGRPRPPISHAQEQLVCRQTHRQTSIDTNRRRQEQTDIGRQTGRWTDTKRLIDTAGTEKTNNTDTYKQ